MPRKKNPNPRHLPENSQLISQNQLSDIESLESDIDLNELPGEQLLQLENIVSEGEDGEWDDKIPQPEPKKKKIKNALKKLKSDSSGISKPRPKRRRRAPLKLDPTPSNISEKKALRASLPTKKYDYVDNNNNVVTPTTTTTTTKTAREKMDDKRKKRQRENYRKRRDGKYPNEKYYKNWDERKLFQISFRKGWSLWREGKNPPKDRLWADEYIASQYRPNYRMKGTQEKPTLKGKEKMYRRVKLDEKGIQKISDWKKRKIARKGRMMTAPTDGATANNFRNYKKVMVAKRNYFVDKEGRYRCGYCDAWFSGASGIWYHLKNNHNMETNTYDTDKKKNTRDANLLLGFAKGAQEEENIKNQIKKVIINKLKSLFTQLKNPSGADIFIELIENDEVYGKLIIDETKRYILKTSIRDKNEIKKITLDFLETLALIKKNHSQEELDLLDGFVIEELSEDDADFKDDDGNDVKIVASKNPFQGGRRRTRRKSRSRKRRKTKRKKKRNKRNKRKTKKRR